MGSSHVQRSKVEKNQGPNKITSYADEKCSSPMRKKGGVGGREVGREGERAEVRKRKTETDFSHERPRRINMRQEIRKSERT